MHDITTPRKGEQIAAKVKPDWYAKYYKVLDLEDLIDIFHAANFMNIKPLSDLCCLAVALKIKGKSRRQLSLKVSLRAADGGTSAPPAPCP